MDVTDPLHPDHPMGFQEIAALIFPEKDPQRTRRLIYTWNNRGHLPDPDYPATNKWPAWKRSTIVVWAARKGKLEDAPHLTDEADRLLGTNA